VLPDEFNGNGECARHIFVIRRLFVVAVQLVVNGAGFEHLRLQRDADGNLLLLAHCRYPHLTLRTVVLAMRTCRGGGAHPTTLSALRQAAACGAGSGGSYGASGGLSGFGGVGTFSLRIAHSFLHGGRRKKYLLVVAGVAVGALRRRV
jgi:hypothetical protein